MTDVAAVRRLALALPGVEDRSTDQRLSFETAAGKGLAWSFMRREHPKRPRVPDLTVLAVRCEMARKEMLIEAAPDRFFDDEHYRGYPWCGWPRWTRTNWPPCWPRRCACRRPSRRADVPFEKIALSHRRRWDPDGPAVRSQHASGERPPRLPGGEHP